MTVNCFLERTFDEPRTPERVLDAGHEVAWCLDLHRVRWHGSFLARDGRAMVCWFSASDLESARLALRHPEVDLSRFWSGTVHERTDTTEPNVVIERSFATPVRLEDIEALGNAKPWCYETHNVTHVRSFFSDDRKRMLCFYAGPDLEAVRSVQRETGAPVARLWAGAPLVPKQR